MHGLKLPPFALASSAQRSSAYNNDHMSTSCWVVRASMHHETRSWVYYTKLRYNDDYFFAGDGVGAYIIMAVFVAKCWVVLLAVLATASASQEAIEWIRTLADLASSRSSLDIKIGVKPNEPSTKSRPAKRIFRSRNLMQSER
jgi:hypothetical protein